jgi:hypothetical protein
MRTRDDVNRNQFTDAARSRGTGIGRRFDRSDITAHDRRYESGTDLFISDELHVGRLDHRIGRLDRGNQTLRLNHSQCFLHLLSLLKLKNSAENKKARPRIFALRRQF